MIIITKLNLKCKCNNLIKSFVNTVGEEAQARTQTQVYINPKNGLENYFGSCIQQKKNSSKTQRFSESNSKVY
jgi:hypothetical protein